MKYQIAVLESAGLKLQDRKMRDRKTWDQNFIIKMQELKMRNWKMQGWKMQNPGYTHTTTPFDSEDKNDDSASASFTAGETDDMRVDCLLVKVQVKVKASHIYSTPSVGPGADPGVRCTGSQPAGDRKSSTRR